MQQQNNVSKMFVPAKVVGISVWKNFMISNLSTWQYDTVCVCDPYVSKVISLKIFVSLIAKRQMDTSEDAGSSKNKDTWRQKPRRQETRKEQRKLAVQRLTIIHVSAQADAIQSAKSLLSDQQLNDHSQLGGQLSKNRK